MYTLCMTEEIELIQFLLLMFLFFWAGRWVSKSCTIIHAHIGLKEKVPTINIRDTPFVSRQSISDESPHRRRANAINSVGIDSDVCRMQHYHTSDRSGVTVSFTA